MPNVSEAEIERVARMICRARGYDPEGKTWSGIEDEFILNWQDEKEEARRIIWALELIAEIHGNATFKEMMLNLELMQMAFTTLRKNI